MLAKGEPLYFELGGRLQAVRGAIGRGKDVKEHDGKQNDWQEARDVDL